MNDDTKTPVVLVALALVFLVLGVLFNRDLWGRVESLASIPLVDPAFTNPAPVRVSAAELKRTGGDTSGLECNACHETNKVLKLEFDAQENVILPKEHNDLVIRHGRHNRNSNCYNCHNPLNLEQLVTRDGRKLTLEESTRLCASCHGPTYRDWEVGVHGRTSGHWQRAAGAITRLDCVSCHHPHSPEFESLAPAPKPNPLHPVVAVGASPAPKH
ncbi:MAG: hypothetical protein HYY24_26735 [Verrucomicrobia bacterium]|nr:hypothetical protein [Verrucomicrobiota bacterium]